MPIFQKLVWLFRVSKVKNKSSVIHWVFSSSDVGSKVSAMFIITVHPTTKQLSCIGDILLSVYSCKRGLCLCDVTWPKICKKGGELQDGAVNGLGSLSWETNQVFLTNEYTNSIKLLNTIDRLVIVAKFDLVLTLEHRKKAILNHKVTISFTAQLSKISEDLGVKVEVDTIKEKRSFNETHAYACKVKNRGSIWERAYE